MNGWLFCVPKRFPNRGNVASLAIEVAVFAAALVIICCLTGFDLLYFAGLYIPGVVLQSTFLVCPKNWVYGMILSERSLVKRFAERRAAPRCAQLGRSRAEGELLLLGPLNGDLLPCLAVRFGEPWWPQFEANSKLAFSLAQGSWCLTLCLAILNHRSVMSRIAVAM